MRLLIIEDDAQVAAYLAKGLKEQGFNVDHASDGKSGLFLAASENYDAMIVDRMLPKLDGIDIIKSVRATGKTIPILILSALGEVESRVEGLRVGADDYLTKPFAFSELLARLDALLRRSNQATLTDTTLQVGDLELDQLTRMVKRKGKKLLCNHANTGYSSTLCSMSAAWLPAPCCWSNYGIIISIRRPM